MLQKILFLSLLILILSTPKVNSQLDILNIVNSPRSIGMGSATINLIDAQSALHNPGAYGLYSFDNNFSLSLPNNTKYLPELADDMRLNSWSIGYGYSNNKNIENKILYSIGAAYSRKSIAYESANYLNSFELRDKADYFTISLGIDYYLQLGVGYTLKKYNFKRPGPADGILEADGYTYDIGMIVELPLHKLLNSSQSADSTAFEVTPSLAIVQMNNGDSSVQADYGSVGSIPKIRRIGFGLTVNHIHNSNSTLKLIFVYEKEKNLVKDLDALTHLGLEVSFYETLYIRTGKTKDKINDRYDYSSFGFGFSLRGFLSYISTSSNSDNAVSSVFDKIDIKFDWATIRKDNHPLDNNKFFKFSITI